MVNPVEVLSSGATSLIRSLGQLLTPATTASALVQHRYVTVDPQTALLEYQENMKWWQNALRIGMIVTGVITGISLLFSVGILSTISFAIIIVVIGGVSGLLYLKVQQQMEKIQELMECNRMALTLQGSDLKTRVGQLQQVKELVLPSFSDSNKFGFARLIGLLDQLRALEQERTDLLKEMQAPGSIDMLPIYTTRQLVLEKKIARMLLHTAFAYGVLKNSSSAGDFFDVCDFPLFSLSKAAISTILEKEEPWKVKLLELGFFMLGGFSAEVKNLQGGRPKTVTLKDLETRQGPIAKLQELEALIFASP